MNVFNFCFFPKETKEETYIELINMKITNENQNNEIKSRSSPISDQKLEPQSVIFSNNVNYEHEQNDIFKIKPIEELIKKNELRFASDSLESRGSDKSERAPESFQEINLYKKNSVEKKIDFFEQQSIELINKTPDSPNYIRTFLIPNELDNSDVLEKINNDDIESLDSLDSFIDDEYQAFSDSPQLIYKFELEISNEKIKFVDYEHLYKYIEPLVQLNGSFYTFTLTKSHHKVTIYMSDIKGIVDIIFNYFIKPINCSIKII
jgi:hypothetical protein